MITLERTVRGSAWQQSARWKLTPGLIICLMAAVAYVSVFFWLQVRLYEGFHMGTRDLVLFDQALYNTLRGDFFQKTYQWESDDIFALPPDSSQQNALRANSLFSEHLYFIMMIVLPIYALFPGAYTLFFLQPWGRELVVSLCFCWPGICSKVKQQRCPSALHISCIRLYSGLPSVTSTSGFTPTTFSRRFS